MKRLLRGSGVVLLLASVLVGCGGGTKKVNPIADLATAKAATLTAADLPGYAQKPYQPSNDIPASVKRDFGTCLHVSTTIFDDTPGAQKAHSSDFSKGQVAVSSDVEIDPKRSDVTTGYDELTKSGIENCLAQLFKAAVKLGAPTATIGDTTTTRFTVGVGNRSVGFATKISAVTQGITIVVYFDVVFVARDRAGIDLTASNVGQSFDRATEVSLARAMYDRVGTKAS